MGDTKINIGGGSFTLFAVFLTLKLCDVIDWSWWWVSAPLWIPLAIALAVLFIIGLALLFIIGLALGITWIIDR